MDKHKTETIFFSARFKVHFSIGKIIYF